MKEITKPIQLAAICKKLDDEYLSEYKKHTTKEEYKYYMIRQAVLYDLFEEITDIKMPII